MLNFAKNAEVIVKKVIGNRQVLKEKLKREKWQESGCRQ
jgi:hypothetical protein